MSTIFNFNKLLINREFILSKLSEQEIFEFYLKKPIKLGTLYKSILRTGDDNPSLNFYINQNKVLSYKDFGHSYGNCFEFVKNYYNCTYQQALEYVANDFKLFNTNIKKEPIISKDIEDNIKFEKQIITVPRPFNEIDKNYWTDRYHIPLDLIIRERCTASKYVYLRKSKEELLLWATESRFNPIYCYHVSNKHKIYRPLNPTKQGKWLSTTGTFEVQGLEYLPQKGEVLIISSSMKDKWVNNILGYSSLAPGGEDIPIPESIMDFLWSCFESIYVFYDSDEAGYKAADKFVSNNQGVKPIFIPNEYKTKDISDFIEKFGKEEAKELMRKLL